MLGPRSPNGLAHFLAGLAKAKMSHRFQEARIGSLAAPAGSSVVHQQARMAGAQGAAQVIAASGTIALDAPVVRVEPAGAVADIRMTAPSREGEQCTLVNTAAAASTVTFAAEGTSNVADATTTVVLAGRRSVHMQAARDAAGVLLWYPNIA